MIFAKMILIEILLLQKFCDIFSFRLEMEKGNCSDNWTNTLHISNSFPRNIRKCDGLCSQRVSQEQCAGNPPLMLKQLLLARYPLTVNVFYDKKI